MAFLDKDGLVALWTNITNKFATKDELNKGHWNGKKWYAYGTSLTASGTGQYAPVVAELSGMILTNKGIPGGGITLGSSSVASAVMNIADGKLEADLITLEVGANDDTAGLGDIYETSDSTFCGNLNQCIRYLQENTTAQIVVISSTNSKYNGAGDNLTPDVKFGPDNHTKYDMYEATRKVCEINGVPYIPMGEQAGFGFYRMNDLYMADRTHHTELGGKNLGYFVWSRLKNIPLWYNE